MDKNQISLTAKILSFTERPYVRKDGTSTVYREALVQMGTTVVRFPVGDTNLKNFEGSEAVLTLEVYSFGNDISAKVRIVSAVEPS